MNQTAERARCELCVHDLVAAQAAAHPQRVAIRCRGDELTYGELEARANWIAAHLAGCGVSADVPVGVFLERSVEFVVTILAILKAGGNYVPLDPNYPTARLGMMLERTSAPVVVTSAALSDRLLAGVTTVLRLEELGGYTEKFVLPRVHPDNLAYTMFTSGSTGVPKAVTIRHRGVVRLVQDPGYVQLDETDVVLHISSTSFDAATFEIWGALSNGARLVIGPAGTPSVHELGALLRAEGVTTVFLTTGLFHLIVDERLEDLSGLRQLVTGGDVLSPSRAHRLVRALPGCRLVNGYGPTEVTTFTTCYDVPREQDLGTVPIGGPINATWIRLLDENLEPVPEGAPGYLYAGGDGLARGYLDDPALTAERFIPDPWSVGERLYSTGDLARSHPDGTLEFLGRADQQVKKRGFRVEPAEIEETLRCDPRLRDAVVVPGGGNAEDRLLVAYLVPDSVAGHKSELISAVRTTLRTQLPDHLIPDRWVVLDALPLNSNGKVDRRALAALSTSDADADAAVCADLVPQGETESTIGAIWCEILNLERVGRNDDFFELGGHSLLAIRMTSRMRNTMGIEIPLSMIFDYPTIARLAELIENV